MDEKEYFRREQDHKWRSDVDHQLNTLMTSQKVLNEQLDEFKEKLDEVHDFLRGGLDGEHDPIETRIRDLERLAQKHDVVIQGDALGNGGLIKTVDYLSSGEDNKTARRGQTLSLVGCVIGAALALSSALYPIVKQAMTARNDDPVEELIEKAKKPKRHHRIVIRPIQEEPATDDVQ